MGTTRSTRSDPPLRRLVVLWADRVWPVGAGGLLAAGLVATADVHGVATTVLTLCGLGALLGVVAHGVLVEPGVRDRRAWRLGPVASLGVGGLLGLSELLPVLAWPLAVGCAVTSPPAVLWALTWWEARRAQHPTSPRTTPPDPRRTDVDRAFTQIVEDLLGQDRRGEP